MTNCLDPFGVYLFMITVTPSPPPQCHISFRVSNVSLFLKCSSTHEHEKFSAKIKMQLRNQKLIVILQKKTLIRAMSI